MLLAVSLLALTWTPPLLNSAGLCSLFFSGPLWEAFLALVCFLAAVVVPEGQRVVSFCPSACGCCAGMTGGVGFQQLRVRCVQHGTAAVGWLSREAVVPETGHVISHWLQHIP